MNTLMHEVKNKFAVTSDFIVEAIETFFEMREKNNPDWISEASLSLKDQLLDFVEQCGVGDNTPSYIVDNFLINGDFISREDWEQSEYNEEGLYFRDWANENCILFNDDFACRSF